MANQWYYTKDDERQGPVSSDDLKKLAEAGELKPDDLIWKEGMEDWRPASQLKGLFGGEAASEQPVRSAASSGERPAAWQIPHLVAALIFIVAMFLPWWSFKLAGMPDDFERAFSKEIDRGQGRVGRDFDFEKFKKVWQKSGWYLRNVGSLSIDFRSIPDPSVRRVRRKDGRFEPREPERIDIRGKVWGFHMGLGIAAGFLGFALIPLSLMMMAWKAARNYSWVTSFLAAYLSLLLLVMTVLWYFESPSYDIKPVFTQGAHIGPYLAMGGSALLLIFGVIEGITSLRAFKRQAKP